MSGTVRLRLSVILVFLLCGASAAEAARGAVRAGARTAVNRNVNVNRHVNVNRDVDVHVHDHGWGYRGCCYHSVGTAVATAAAVTATTMVTAAVVGSIVHTLPASCTVVVVNGIGYQQCGSTWYQPQLSATNTTYVVVNPPASAPAATGTPPAPAIGSTVQTLPPSCTEAVVKGTTYLKCGDVWYQPQVSGPTTTYLVVNPPL